MDDNKTTSISSEYTINTCGEPVYNVLPSDTACTNPPHVFCGNTVIYTDQVYDKEREQWQSDINQGIGSSTGTGSGGGGGKGEDALIIQLFTDVGNILTNTTQCTITAEVWNGHDRIDNIPSYYFSWVRISSNKNRDDSAWNAAHMHYGNSIIVPISEIQKQTLYQCEFDFEQYFKYNN